MTRRRFFRAPRIGGSAGFGPFRLGVSFGRSGTYARAGVRAGRRGWLYLSEPVGGRRRRTR